MIYKSVCIEISNVKVVDIPWWMYIAARVGVDNGTIK